MMKVNLMEHREKDDLSRGFETFYRIALNLLLNMNEGRERGRLRHQRLKQHRAAQRRPVAFFSKNIGR
jgi:hypothetical protein